MADNLYTDLIPSWNRGRPKFTAMVREITAPFLSLQTLLNSYPTVFDIDSAIGNQLDILGIWIGLGRNIRTPITDVYFALDTDKVGFDQGSWKRPYDSDSGFTELDDDTYRTVLRAKIQANRWDGTCEMLGDIYQGVFPDEKTKIFAVDNFDMTMTIYIAGSAISAVMQAIIAKGYLDVKPEGVGVTNYIISTETGPLFGFDVGNDYTSGFDISSWGEELRVKNG